MHEKRGSLTYYQFRIPLDPAQQLPKRKGMDHSLTVRENLRNKLVGKWFALVLFRKCRS